MRRYITLLIAALSTLGSAYAQQGLLFNRDIMMVSDMANLSQSSFQYGTARSMALGGAITSLGADATSMQVNPAGLGMYRKGEITMTPLISISRSKGGSEGADSGESVFAIGNIAVVYTMLKKPKGNLLAINVGIGANRVADYNYRYSTYAASNSSSVADVFARQLSYYNTPVSDLQGEKKPDWSTLNTAIWGAALGYKADLVDGDGSSWDTSWINPDATVTQKMLCESSGSAWEFELSAGGNLSNKLYFGATLGVQGVYQRLDYIYDEAYNNNSAYGGESAYLLSSYYSQAIITSGSGVNMKFGVTYRPVEALRVGVAYHTPTYYSLDRSYQASVGSVSIDGGERSAVSADSDILEDISSNRWRYRTSGKLLAGVSYTFGNRALIAFDYQLDRYANTTIRNTPAGVAEQFYDASDIYQDQHTLKAGVEVKVCPQIALRLGGAWSTDLIRDASALFDLPTINRTAHGSFGVGVMLSRLASLDLTYMAQYNEYSNYTLYSDAEIQSGGYWLDIWQHNIAFTITFRV